MNRFLTVTGHRDNEAIIMQIDGNDYCFFRTAPLLPVGSGQYAAPGLGSCLYVGDGNVHW